MREKSKKRKKKDLLFTLAEPPTGEYILGGHDAIFYQQGKNWKTKETGGNLWATASLRSLVYIT